MFLKLKENIYEFIMTSKENCETSCIIALSFMFGIIALGILSYMFSVLFQKFCRTEKEKNNITLV